LSGSSGTLMSSLNLSINTSSMIPFSALRDPNKKFAIRHKFGAVVPSIMVAESVGTYLECSLDDLYIIEGSFYPYAYYKDFTYIELLSLDQAILEFTDVKKRIKRWHEDIKEYLELKNFDSLFVLRIDKRISFLAYTSMYAQIPDDQKYQVFTGIYTHNEYGFSLLDKTLVRSIFSHRSEPHKQDVLSRISTYVVDGKVTVYRGESSKSTPYSEAFSWTTDLRTAHYFATRFSESGKIYKTEVPVEDIVDFMDNRNEYEILLLPESVGDVEMIEVTSVAKLMANLRKVGVVKRFTSYKRKLKPELFHNPTGCHAVGHCTRVLFHVLNLSHVLKLSSDEERILVQAALYHDIGRTHDYEDVSHGFLGYEKMKSLGLGKVDSPQEALMLRYIIEMHCVDDKEAYTNVEGRGIEDEEKALYLLKIFKDADGLDRVRLGDLDTKYLRLPESILFVALAKSLFEAK
jgi:hypothetical protein